MTETAICFDPPALRRMCLRTLVTPAPTSATAQTATTASATVTPSDVEPVLIGDTCRRAAAACTGAAASALLKNVFHTCGDLQFE